LYAKNSEGFVTCPFAPGQDAGVTTYSYKGHGPCDPSRFSGLKVLSVREIDGRSGRREMRCATDVAMPRPAQVQANAGRSWLLTFDVRNVPPYEIGEFDGQLEAWRLGAPFVMVAGGERFRGQSLTGAVAYKCVQMLPGVDIDALTFFREAGPPFPKSVAQEEVTGRDCAQLIRDKVGKFGSTSGAAIPLESEEGLAARGEFNLWLYSSRQSPQGAKLLKLIRSVLVRDGVQAARESGREVFAYGTELVSKTRDGGYVGFVGGPDTQSVDIRGLTPGVCEVLFDVASEGGLYFRTNQTDTFVLRPETVTEDSMVKANVAVSVASGADLCAMLRPGFDEWKESAPKLPADLNDIDRRKVVFFGFHLAR
jgi:hypothetical protein